MRVLLCRDLIVILSLLLGTGLFETVHCQLCEGNPSPSPNCARPVCNGATCDPKIGCGLCSPCQCRRLGIQSTNFECRSCSREKCQCSNLLIEGTSEQPCCDGLICIGSGSKPAASLGSCKKVS